MSKSVSQSYHAAIEFAYQATIIGSSIIIGDPITDENVTHIK
jgi:hypothetical protein